jgi:hypothetical protein
LTLRFSAAAGCRYGVRMRGHIEADNPFGTLVFQAGDRGFM